VIGFFGRARLAPFASLPVPFAAVFLLLFSAVAVDLLAFFEVALASAAAGAFLVSAFLAGALAFALAAFALVFAAAFLAAFFAVVLAEALALPAAFAAFLAGAFFLEAALAGFAFFLGAAFFVSLHGLSGLQNRSDEAVGLLRHRRVGERCESIFHRGRQPGKTALFAPWNDRAFSCSARPRPVL